MNKSLTINPTEEWINFCTDVKKRETLLLYSKIRRRFLTKNSLKLENFNVALSFKSMARTQTLSQCHVSTFLLHNVETQAQFPFNLINVFTHRVPYTLIHYVQ